jgi:hypothetical protein
VTQITIRELEEWDCGKFFAQLELFLLLNEGKGRLERTNKAAEAGLKMVNELTRKTYHTHEA